MSDRVELVDYQEALSIRVGEFLLSKGFALASSTGVALYSLGATNSLGILYTEPDAKPQKYFFGLFSRRPRRTFLGTIWLDNGPRAASEGHWVFEMYGRKDIEMVKQLAEEMASAFDVKILLRLVSRQSDVETYMTDYGD